MTAFSLDDKYTLTEGRVAMTGIQALVRLPMDQHRRDREAGLRVGAFISGYPGSPLGEYDKQLMRNGRLLAEHDVVFQPGINEETAATSIYGAQLLERFPHQRYDGVVGIWYGKTPGVDRTGDAFRHGNFIGTGKHGGVLVLAGDDTACKSSTIPGDSTISLFDLSMPVLYPGDPAEVLELGLHGIAPVPVFRSVDRAEGRDQRRRRRRSPRSASDAATGSAESRNRRPTVPEASRYPAAAAAYGRDGAPDLH